MRLLFHLSFKAMMSCLTTHSQTDDVSTGDWLHAFFLGEADPWITPRICKGCNNTWGGWKLFGNIPRWNILINALRLLGACWNSPPHTYVLLTITHTHKVVSRNHLKTGMILRVSVYPAEESLELDTQPLKWGSEVLLLLMMCVHVSRLSWVLIKTKSGIWSIFHFSGRNVSASCYWFDKSLAHVSDVLFVFSFLNSVPHHRRRPLRPEDSHRARFAGGQSGGDWEERLLLQEQCAAPLAVHHPRPAGPRGQEVLRQILRRGHRPHQWVSDSAGTKQASGVWFSLTWDHMDASESRSSLWVCTVFKFVLIL